MRLKFAALLSLLLLLLLLSITSDARRCNAIQLQSGIQSSRRPVCNCESWRLSVEAHNKRNWTMVPAECVKYVGEYMTRPDGTNQTQYESDLHVVSRQIMDYLQELPPPSAGDTWVFDLMNTLISDVEYYALTLNMFGGTSFSKEQYNAWLWNPASQMNKVPHMLTVYYAAKFKGYKIVIISGNSIDFENTLSGKLRTAGFGGWDELVLNNDPSVPSRKFKESVRAELLKNGNKVIGNVGDQWSDLQGGDNVGSRVFKLPNPMYYAK